MKAQEGNRCEVEIPQGYLLSPKHISLSLSVEVWLFNKETQTHHFEQENF